VAAGAELIAAFDAAFGAHHPHAAFARTAHATTLLASQRAALAIPHLTTAMAIRKAATGAQNPTFGSEAVLLGRALVDLGRPDEAEPLLLDAEQAYTAVRGERHRAVAMLRVERGRSLGRRGQFATAEPLLVDNLPLLEHELPATRADVRRTRQYLAEFYAAWQAAEPDPARAEQAAAWRTRADATR
jgi:nephrocystin-3